MTTPFEIARRNLDLAVPGWSYRRESASGDVTWKWTTSAGEWRLAMQNSEMLKLNGALVDVNLHATQVAAMVELMVNLGAIERLVYDPDEPVGRCNNCHRSTHIPQSLGRRCNANTSGGGAVCDGTLVDLDHASLKGSLL